MYALHKQFVAMEQSAAGRCYPPEFNWSIGDRFAAILRRGEPQ
jgi:hypothetical protein